MDPEVGLSYTHVSYDDVRSGRQLRLGNSRTVSSRRCLLQGTRRLNCIKLAEIDTVCEVGRVKY